MGCIKCVGGWEKSKLVDSRHSMESGAEATSDPTKCGALLGETELGYACGVFSDRDAASHEG